MSDSLEPSLAGSGTIGRFSLMPVLLLWMILTLYLGNAGAQDVDMPVASSIEEYGDCDDKTAELLITKYPKWYELVSNAVNAVRDSDDVMNCGPLMRELRSYFYKNTATSTKEIYDFFKHLECDIIGKRFIEEMKKTKNDKKKIGWGDFRDICEIDITAENRTGNVGRFIGTIFYGEVIFGTPNADRYSSKRDTPTIIFAPNTDSVLSGGNSFDFLIGGAGNDVLCGYGDGEYNGPILDVLAGGDGDDIYIFPKRGSAFIFENNTPAAGHNTLRVEKAFNRESLYFELRDGILYIDDLNYLAGGVVIYNWTPKQPDGHYDLKKVNEYPPIQKIEFSDGTALDVQKIMELIKQR